ncbi:glycerol-3-phosphate 1-O-acyltransferase [Nocardia puris]|uniref:Glycerol-3-phosphate acyltransferase n=1 Tax=Nocardia puris TaxID=208602 RepID=A0A366DA56_9NOCA|nr:glycerol-3-phosphate 1-O-acyltransferase [Nocardia puris]MBF6211763.1 glycerol-3-phosphate 1-O-acyltransferase [Nocardia puris]MBF6365766.1 glycerol-3-phosphate 1-O-acyltransferase [Nocardia puris]MBF6460591.1 glycerol-3-phosphate 1-O-acyltransferase [Nocardia puris]RBO86941.1 glycerol-3-phosphate acyltransferase [Nocardia puris]
MIEHRGDPSTTTRSATEPRSVVALVDAASGVERDLIGSWLGAGGIARETGVGAPVTQLDLDPRAVAERLAGRRDDPLVVPVRVLWLPPERDGVRRLTFADLAMLTNPRKPHRLAQRRLVRRHPDRHAVIIGQPALLSELRANNPEAAALHAAGTTEPLARAVVRAAVVALERAERTVIGDRYKVPRLVTEEILDSPDFLRRLEYIADSIGEDPQEVYRRAEKCLGELVAAQSRLVSDLFTQAMRPVHASTWKVDTDESGLVALRALNRRYPLVFLPSHRSYVDAFVLGDVLARNDFPPNHVIGGANLRFWPMGPIARRTGTVFIRRSFGDDEVYKAVVEEYFAYLLAKRFNLEWYFEGGRTRTGKLRPPRYGLLNYLASAVRADRVDDVMLVPVSITYERLNELGAIATEQVGGTKKPEGLTWLARYIRNQQHSAGHVYVRFGEPLSARDRLAAHGDPLAAPRVSIPLHSIDSGRDSVAEEDAEIAELERKAVQRLAFEVAVGINAVTPITVNALVTLALLGVHERALTLGEVRALLAPVLGYIAERGLPSGEIDALRDEQNLAVVLEQLSVAKVVTVYRGGLEPVYSIESGAHLEAAFYRNSAVHWFVNRAILELSILAAVDAGEPDQLQFGWDEAFRLRDLLKFEFFFPDRAEFTAQITREVLLIDPEWNTRTRKNTLGADVLGKLTASGFMMAHRVLRSFVDAQLVVAERLAARDAAEEIDRKEFLAECVSVGKQMLLQQRLHSPESVSTELFGSALKLADNYGLLAPVSSESAKDRSELTERRREFAARLRSIGARITQAAALDPSNIPGREA